jgi:Pyruvate/2-oxoacid:ferredoxin oxidoreductase delta subunit
MMRKIVRIDEEKCDGCGLCASACAEGAIEIIDGKARLVSDSYCDGLGACLGECPRDAITIIEREAEEFDEKAVEEHIASPSRRRGGTTPNGNEAGRALACGCPGTMARELTASDKSAAGEDSGEWGRIPSRLLNWPVQLHLVPVNAPYLRGARLLLAADCVGFASPDFHRRFLNERILIIGCPKLDDAAFYREKLATILRVNGIREITVAFMEVPCCSSLVNLAQQALRDSGKDIPFSTVKVGIEGEILEIDGEPSLAHSIR